MLADIVKWGVIGVALLIVFITAFAMCKSASSFDDISEEVWKDYWENKDEKSVH
jgi:hypothetical protein